VNNLTDNKTIHLATAVKLGGAFMATCIGSGYDTGAEFLQFFAVYGVAGAIGAILVSLIILAKPSVRSLTGIALSLLVVAILLCCPAPVPLCMNTWVGTPWSAVA